MAVSRPMAQVSKQIRQLGGGRGGARRVRRRRGPSMIGRIFGFFFRLGLLGIATAVLFTALGTLSYFLIEEYISGDEIVAPRLHGKSVTEALAALGEWDLTLVMDDEEQSDLLEPGFILRQHPRPGTTIKRGTPIRIVVSSGRRRVSLPAELIGISRIEASVGLREIGLTVGNIAYLPTYGRQNDIVLATDPAPGASVPNDTPVNLLVTVDRGPAAPAGPGNF